MLHRLIYVSKAKTSALSDIDGIVISSKKNNAELEITGSLCLLNGVYCQYVEGDLSVIQALYWKLLTDVRHRDVRLLDLSAITQRLFGDWAMALMTWNEQTRAVFEELDPTDALDLYAITATAAAAMFEALARSSECME